MIQVKNLHKSFGKNNVLRGIEIDFSQPGITCILGPNGSGKTTLIKSILGLNSIDDGDILFNGQTIKNHFLYRKDINHLPQIANFPDNLTGRELITLVRDVRSAPASVEYFIEIFDLEKELGKKMGTLSGGNRQKVNLLLSLMFDNPVLILDEPTSGLDPLAIQNLKSYLFEQKEKGKYILITTHIIDFAEKLSDRVIYLLDGHIYYDGKIDGLLKRQGETHLEDAIASILRSHKSLPQENSLKHV